MEFIFRLLDTGLAGLVLKAILLSLLGIFMLIGFIVARRWYRGRYFQKLNARTFILRSAWDKLVTGQIPPETWRLNRFDSQVVETILLDSIEMASSDELGKLLQCLRSSGLLDMRIYDARNSNGWKRRAALVALGRTRAPEAVPALAEALGDKSEQTRIAAVRGLGRIGSAEAAVPLLDRFVSGQLGVPEHTLKNALATCCRNCPEVLMKYLHHASGKSRELLARVLAEVATPELGEELLVLATDPLPEVRASAARALASVNEPFALSALRMLIEDQEWFVRLRAVVALGSIRETGRIRLLLRALCDANRYVRQRAAWSLARFQPNLDAILELVLETKDSFALQAFISELERSGDMEKLIQALQAESDQDTAQAVLLKALAVGRERVETARQPKAIGAAAGAGK